MKNEIQNKYLGCFLGLAIGDALGTTLEGISKNNVSPVSDMIGGGMFNLVAGEYTDDTSMALCLAQSLISTKGFDPLDQIQRYCRWWREGYFSSTGECFGIGQTVIHALERFEQTDEPYSGSLDPLTAGNGSLMRIAPIAMQYRLNINKTLHYAKLSSKVTHGASEAVYACQYTSYLLLLLLNGMDKHQAIENTIEWSKGYFKNVLNPNIAYVFCGSFKSKTAEQIMGSSYVVSSLEASLWAFYHGDDYKEAVLLATNLGDDADTTSAITGQLSGAYYGINSIPKAWLAKLVDKNLIESMALDLFKQSGNSDE